MAEYEMQRLAQKEKGSVTPHTPPSMLAQRVHAACLLTLCVCRSFIAAFGGGAASAISGRQLEEFHQIIKDVVRGMGEASSKAASVRAKHRI